MPINRPYRRTCRPFSGSDAYPGNSVEKQYPNHPEFANSPEHYVRAFLLILKDLKELFDYVEPSDRNLKCYSYRIHSLLLRACVEVEANCKAILKENIFTKSENWNIDDYKKINQTHKLSSFQVKTPNWTGKNSIRIPFEKWANSDSLPWYQAYNKTKHDRHNEFPKATFDHLLDAVCGLLVVLSAQFGSTNYSPAGNIVTIGGEGDGFQNGLGEFFRVKFPTDWQEESKYDFNWPELSKETEPFDKINFDNI